MSKKTKDNSWSREIKNVGREGGSRFWLLISVVLATIVIFVVWSMNIKENYFTKTSIAHPEGINLNQASLEINKTLEDFYQILDNLGDTEDLEESEEMDSSQNNDNLINNIFTSEDLEKIKKELEDNKKKKSSSSEVPALYPDLDNSEQIISDLKKRIEDLEAKLE